MPTWDPGEPILLGLYDLYIGHLPDVRSKQIRGITYLVGCGARIATYLHSMVSNFLGLCTSYNHIIAAPYLSYLQLQLLDSIIAIVNHIDSLIS